MAEEADYGLMLWDGRSRGTLTNVVHLIRQSKPVLVYVAPQKAFYTVKDSDHLLEMTRRFDPTAVNRVSDQLRTAIQRLEM